MFNHTGVPENRMNQFKQSQFLRPGKQHGGRARQLRVALLSAFWILLLVAMFTATAGAQQAKEGGVCSPPNAKTQIVVAGRVGGGPLKLYTKSCVCTHVEDRPTRYAWVCEWD